MVPEVESSGSAVATSGRVGPMPLEPPLYGAVGNKMPPVLKECTVRLMSAPRGCPSLIVTGR